MFILRNVGPARRVTLLGAGFVQSVAQQFSRPGKTLENVDKVWENGKNSSFLFCFQSYNKYFISEFFFPFFFFFFFKSYSISPVRLHYILKQSFVPAFFKVSIDRLFDELQSGKRNYCFGK